MKAISVPTSSVNLTFDQDDILVVKTRGARGALRTEIALLSIVALTAREVSQFSLLSKVVEDHKGVITWRVNQITEEPRKTQHSPFEIIVTHNFMIVKEQLRISEPYPDFLLKRVTERLLTKRTTVLSTLATGFNFKILTKDELLQVYLHKTDTKAAKQYVPFDRTFIRPIVELERVPKRLIPNLPFNFEPIAIPLGTHFLNPQKIVGLTPQTGLVIFGGSERHLLIAALQHYIQCLAQQGKKVIVLDYENELNGLISSLIESKVDKFPINVIQLGHNLSLNLCHIDVPTSLKSRERHLTYQANFLGYLLAFASGSNNLYTNIAHLQSRLLETMAVLPPETLSLKNILQADKFTDSNTDLEFTLTEQFQADLELYANTPALNSHAFMDEKAALLTPQSGVTVFQFPTPLLPIKRIMYAFLIHALSVRCDSETVVVVTHASKIFTLENRDPESKSGQIYSEILGNSFSRLTRDSCLTLATDSLVRFHPDIQKACSSGIFFRFSNDEERDWIARRYALTQYMEDPNRFLQSLDNEGLLFNLNTSVSIEHFIPYTLLPVITAPSFIQHTNLLSKSHKQSKDQFVAFMTILELLANGEIENTLLLNNLSDLGIETPSFHLQELKASGSIMKRRKGNSSFYSNSKSGNILLHEYLDKIEHLPAVLNSQENKIANIKENLRERVHNIEHLDDHEYQQLVLDIQEFLGSILRKFFSTQIKIDWGIFKDFLSEIENKTDRLLIQRMELVERIFRSIDWHKLG